MKKLKYFFTFHRNTASALQTTLRNKQWRLRLRRRRRTILLSASAGCPTRNTKANSATAAAAATNVQPPGQEPRKTWRQHTAQQHPVHSGAFLWRQMHRRRKSSAKEARNRARTTGWRQTSSSNEHSPCWRRSFVNSEIQHPLLRM